MGTANPSGITTGSSSGLSPSCLLHLRWFLALATTVILVAWVLVWAIADIDGEPNHLYAMLNVAGERNLPTWWNSTLLLLVAVLATLAARSTTREPSGSDRTANPGGLGSPTESSGWWVVALTAGTLGLDETVMLHERLLALVRSGHGPLVLWLALGALFAGLAVLVLVVTRGLPTSTRRGLAACLAIYAIGAVVVDFLGERLLQSNLPQSGYVLAMVVEEAFEMAACILAVSVIGRHLITAGQRARRPLVDPTWARRVLGGLLGLWAVIGLATVVVLGSGARGPVLDQLRALIDVTGESNVPEWYATSALALIGFGLIWLGLLVHGAHVKAARGWWGASGVVLLMSWSQATSMHRLVGDALKPAWAGVLGWTVVGVLFGIVLVGAATILLPRLDPLLARPLMIACGGFLFGAVALEMVVLLLRQSGSSLSAVVSVVAASTEAAALALAVGAVLLGIARRSTAETPNGVKV